MGSPLLEAKNEKKDNMPCRDWIEFLCCAEPARSSASGTHATRSFGGIFLGAASTREAD